MAGLVKRGGPRCGACRHEDVDVINAMIVEGSQSDAKIAAKFRLSKYQIERHRRNHLPLDLIRAKQAEQGLSIDKTWERLESHIRMVDQIAARNFDRENDKEAIAALSLGTKQIELTMKLLGELDERPEVNVVVNNPQYIMMRSALMEALKEFPEARARASRALIEMGDQSDD